MYASSSSPSILEDHPLDLTVHCPCPPVTPLQVKRAAALRSLLCCLTSNWSLNYSFLVTGEPIMKHDWADQWICARNPLEGQTCDFTESVNTTQLDGKCAGVPRSGTSIPRPCPHQGPCLQPPPHPPLHSGERESSMRTDPGTVTVGQGHPKDDLPPPQRNKSLVKMTKENFPGGAVIKNQPANAGDTGSSPGLGRSHMPQSN